MSKNKKYMENYTKLGTPTSIYEGITYTPTKFSQSETPGVEKDKPVLDWAREMLKTNSSSSPSVGTSSSVQEFSTDYWDAFKKNQESEVRSPMLESSSDETKLRDMKITNPTGSIYNSKEDFKNSLYTAYLDVLKKHNINPEFAKYLVAQDALESAYGKSSLSKYNNFGGVKASSDSPYVEFKTKEWDKGKNAYKEIVSKFRSFDSLEDYCEYKIKLLGNDNYKTFTRCPEEFADSLTTYAKYKYATAPDYKQKIERMVRSL